MSPRGGAAGGGGGQRGGGSRQPLTQRRPKKARKGVSAAKVKAGGVPRVAAKAAARGGAPPKSKIPSGRAPSITKSSPAGANKRRQKSLGGTGPFAGRPLNDYAAELLRRLFALYPDAHCELAYRSPWQLVVATVLSAQCTDKRVNMVTPVLFAAYPSPADLASAPQDAIEEIIKSTGFFRNKAKSIIGLANAVVDRYGGQVPSQMSDLVTLPGVGRKTANVVLGNAFQINDGVVVDTHVARLSERLGLTKETDPIRIEQALMPLFPQNAWTMLSHLLIWHGRRVCDARKPRCSDCTIANICPSAQLP